MKFREIVPLLLSGLMCCVDLRATDLPFNANGSTNFCSFKRFGVDPLSSYFEFNAETGVLTLLKDGDWAIYYLDSPGFGNPNAARVDIPGVRSAYVAGPSGPFSVRLEGRSIVGRIDLDLVNSPGGGDFRLFLKAGGSIDAVVTATSLHMVDADVAGGVGPAGNLQVWDLYRGAFRALRIGGDVRGRVQVLRNVRPNANIEILGSLRGQVRVAGELAGEVRINGSLVEGYPFGDEVEVGSMPPSTGAVVVDFDGFCSSDRWQSGTVRIGSQVFSSNSPSHRVFEITSCRGDMDNDGVVDSTSGAYDLARDNPAGYAAAYPGLSGSRAYHVDFGLSAASAQTPCADINRDATIVLDDLSVLLAQFGTSCPLCFTLLGDQGEAAMSVAGEAVDPDFVEWARQASLRELFNWNEEFLSGDWAGLDR